MDPTKNYLDRQKKYLSESSNFKETPIYKTLKLGTQLLDPTGISSYGDVYDAYSDFQKDKSFSNGANLALETFGALPVIGKLGKVSKGFKYLSKYTPVLSKASTIIDKGVDFQKSLDNAKDIRSNGMKIVEQIPIRKGRGGSTRYKNILNKDTWFDPTLKGVERTDALNKIQEFKEANKYLKNNKIFNATQIGIRGAANLDDGMDILNIF